jgi:hypothetical protein
MARTYGELTALVRNWSNRDEQVLSDGVVQDCLRYAADKAYRTLRVPPLEQVISYSSANLIAATTKSSNNLPSRTELSIPSDLIEFIQIREVDANKTTTRVFNQKVDVRTFNDAYTDNEGPYWTRQANTIILSPGFNDGSRGVATGIELYYYKRLPALNADYSVTPSNYAAGLLNQVAPTVDGSITLYLVTLNNVTTAYATLAEATATGGTPVATNFLGQLVPNWLRDENERILLNGALAETFFYLQDDEQAQKYGMLFSEEIKSLNDEDNKRNARGGNIQINYSGSGLI